MGKRYWVFLLLAFSLAGCPPMAFSKDKGPVVQPTPSVMWQNLLNSLHELKRLQAEQVSELQTLRTDNETLQGQLRASQQDLQALQHELTEWDLSLTASLQQSRNLSISIDALTTDRDRHRMTWRIGIPVASVLAFFGGLYVANR